jgi:hypothetical protein
MGYEFDWDKAKENAESLFQWTYWIVGILVAFVISYILYTKFNKQVASILVFIATMMALYYYYVKWFVIGDPYPVPQSICPDFMSSIGVVGTNQFVCLDKSGNYPSFGTASSYDSVIQVQQEVPGFPTTIPAGGKVTNSVTGAGYVITPATGATAAEKTSFCGDLKTQKLSWISYCDY